MLRFRDIHESRWDLCEDVCKCLDDHVPEALHLTAHDWMKQCFRESVSKIRRAILRTRQLRFMSVEQRKQLNEGKAYEFARLVRYRPAIPQEDALIAVWLETARSTSNADFKKAVDLALGAKGIPPEEQRVRVHLSLTVSMFALWNQALEKAARVHELDLDIKRSEAIEAVLAHYFLTPEEVLTAEAE